MDKKAIINVDKLSKAIYNEYLSYPTVPMISYTPTGVPEFDRALTSLAMNTHLAMTQAQQNADRYTVDFIKRIINNSIEYVDNEKGA